jgi:hypothetical protein
MGRPRKYALITREEFITTIGGKCAHCPESDWRRLQVDHVKGDGREDRRNTKFSGGNLAFWHHVIQSVKNNEGRYQLLCGSCNWMKKYMNKEVRGKAEPKQLTDDEMKNIANAYGDAITEKLHMDIDDKRLQHVVNNLLNLGPPTSQEELDAVDHEIQKEIEEFEKEVTKRETSNKNIWPTLKREEK